MKITQLLKCKLGSLSEHIMISPKNARELPLE